MTVSDKTIAINSAASGNEVGWADGVGESPKETKLRKLFHSEFSNVLATFLTTLAIYSVFLAQGFVVARILGPLGRGEFGTALFFPRDVLLYAGLLGGVEVINALAVKSNVDTKTLKYSAARLGLLSGLITATVAAILAVVVMVCVGKSYLIPFCLVCCVFVPWEHMQLTISAVDRGTRNFAFYNVNRFVYAISFLALLLLVFGVGLNQSIPFSDLTIVCGLFVISRIVGLAPTLRGMDVTKTLFGKKELSSTGDDVEVPSAWELLVKGRFYAISMLASEVFERMDVLLVVTIASVVESGYFFVAVPAAQLLTVAPNALGVFTFNAGSDDSKRIGLRKTLLVMTLTVLMQIVSALILAWVIPVLILYFFKAPFAPAIPFALWLLPAYAIKGYLQAADGFLKGRNKPMIGVWARALSIVVMLCFVGLVYSNVIGGFEQKIFCIPVAALIGQAISMVIISAAVIRDAIEGEASNRGEYQCQP